MPHGPATSTAPSTPSTPPVEVLGESPKSYAIRIAFPIGGHKAKETMTVRKHNVRFKEVEPVQHDCSKEWWNQLD